MLGSIGHWYSPTHTISSGSEGVMSVARSSSSCDWMQAREPSSAEHSASHPWWDAGPTSFMHLEPQPAVQPGGQVGVVEHAGLALQPAQKSARKNEEAGAIAGDGKRALSKQSPTARAINRRLSARVIIYGNAYFVTLFTRWA